MANKVARAGRMLLSNKHTEAYLDHLIESMPLKHCGGLDLIVNEIQCGALFSIVLYITSTNHLSLLSRCHRTNTRSSVGKMSLVYRNKDHQYRCTGADYHVDELWPPLGQCYLNYRAPVFSKNSLSAPMSP